MEDYQKLLVDHLDLVDRVVRHIARRHHLAGADLEEFASVVSFRLIDHDYAILRKFQGRSSLATYLTTVVERLYLDFCITRWGKWRPSAAARRLGPDAIRLEQLLGRDGLTFDEAVTLLQMNHHVSATRDELDAIRVQLPTRLFRRLEPEREVSAGSIAVHDLSLEREEDRQIVHRVETALGSEIARLPPRHRLILKMRFHDAMPVVNIARLLHVPATGMYRELHGIIEGLQQRLRTRGIDKTDIDRIVGHPGVALGRILETVREVDDGSV